MRGLVGFGVRFVAWAAISAAVLWPSMARAADPPKETLTGEIVAARATWRGSRIVTVVELKDAAGSVHTLTQPGGTTGGIGMRMIPSPRLMAVGDQVQVEVDRPARAGDAARVRSVAQLASLPPGSIPFVRTTNKTGAELYWASGCVFITYDAAGTNHLAGDQEFDIMDAVLQHWETSISSCSYMRFEIDAPADVEVGYDRENVIKIRESSWCRPASGDDPEECYDAQAAGLTTLFFVDDESSERNGEILDADIELNAVNFTISANGQSLGGPGCMSDLANTLTHEVGHLLGLDHTCWTGVGDIPIDGNGDPAPRCSTNLPAAIEAATMYNFQDCGETSKSSLEADDIAAACAIYPSADDPGTCSPVRGTGGCCSTSSDPRSAAGAVLLGLLALVRVTRRRR